MKMWFFYGLALLLIISFLWYFTKADGDLTLLFFEKFGREPDFQQKVIWITGGSSGIGEQLAYETVRKGCKGLVISGVNSARLSSVKETCILINPGADVLVLPFLMQDFDSHAKCVETVLQHFGRLDILVNNAGVSQKANFIDINIEVDKKVFDINVFGTINLTRNVMKHFKTQNTGQIVVSSSMAGKIGAPFSSSYTGSKHALHGYFEGLRMELAKTNISVNIVCPGPTMSRLRSRCATGTLDEVHAEEQPDTAKKMKTSRCSALMTVAIVNDLSESWICLQPLLTLMYLSQYTPAIFRSIFVKYLLDPEKAAHYRSGCK